MTIAGTSWRLYQGFNGSMNVFSFVAVSSPLTSFSADAKLFLTYLVSNQGLPSSYFVNSRAFFFFSWSWPWLMGRSYSVWDGAVCGQQRQADRFCLLGGRQLERELRWESVDSYVGMKLNLMSGILAAKTSDAL